MSENLDEKDFAIIDELKKNARLSEKKIAKRTNIPMTTVHNRMKKLGGLGVIENYTLRLNYKKLDLPLTAYVLLKTLPGVDQKEMLIRISRLPYIREVAMVTGEFDILFKVRVKSMEELNKTVVQTLRKQKTIGETRTMISYETIEVL
ncbi:MAG: Lrp/AsnC family transcriptional regulator [Candidatus Micrarchaeia archaeon]